MVMAIEDFDIHPKFTLNGHPYDKSGLKELAYDLVKEGTAFEKSMGDFLSDWLDDSSTLNVRTSGSTGEPKEISLKKEHMVNSALATGEFFSLEEGSSALLCLPVDYIAGKMMLVRAMVLGLELDYVEPSTSPLSQLSKSYDFAAMVPIQSENSLAEIERIKTLIVGGATISKSLKDKLQKKSTAIFETYGMTETITHVAVQAVSSAQPGDKVSRVGNRFKALPNIVFSVDARGCLVVTAPRVAYHPIITNDIVELISETEFKWLGRYDNVINSGGVKLYPEQIENKLEKVLDKRFFVAGLPDENLGQKLVLIVEGNIDSDELLETLQETSGLERFEVPKEIHALPNFVETDTGKIHRKKNFARLIT